jgi:hypothetical protein
MSNITQSGNNPVLYEYRCKICNLANLNPDLFKDLHSQVLEVGSSYNRAMNYINARIDNEQIGIPKLNNQNMSVHFSSHITLPEKVNHEITRNSPMPPSLKDVNPELGGFVEDIVRRKVGNEVNDYLNLDSLRAQLLEKLELLDGIIEKETPSGDKVIDMDALGYYTSLAKELRACIVDLNKIRSSKQLMATMIKSLIQKNTFETVRQLSREYDQIRQDLLDAGVNEMLVTKTDQALRIKLAEVVANTARSAVEDVTRQYKLG